MDYDILKSVSQRSDGAQDSENCRIAAIANELHRLCQLHETQSGTGQADVTPFEREQRVAEQIAKTRGCIERCDLFSLYARFCPFSAPADEEMHFF